MKMQDTKLNLILKNKLNTFSISISHAIFGTYLNASRLSIAYLKFKFN